MKKNYITAYPILIQTSKEDVVNTILSLPTQEGKLYKPLAGGEWRRLVKNGGQAHYLYLISDEEPQEGDWVLHWSNDLQRHVLSQHAIGKSSGKKVVAASDKSLKSNKFKTGVFKNLEYELPKIPDYFIKEFVNEDGVIGGVLLEVENPFPEAQGNVVFPKVLSLTKDNEVVVHLKKEINNIDDLMEELHGKLIQRRVYTMEIIQKEFNIDTGSLKGVITPMEWGMKYERKDLKTKK